MFCIMTGCKVKLSTGEVYSSDAFAVGENLMFVLAREPYPDAEVVDVTLNREDRFHYWERQTDTGMVICAAQPAMADISQALTDRIDKFFEEWFQTLPQDEVVELDRYEPDYDRTCESCGRSPTVTGIKDNQVVLSLGLCGACTWGEQSAFDPSTWN